MNKFKDLSIGGTIILIIILALEIYYYYEGEDEIDRLKSLDFNKDGKVSRRELKYYLKLVAEKDKRQSLKLKEMGKNAASGFVRGLLMGLVLNTLEGGIVLGIILGIINPILANADKIVY